MKKNDAYILLGLGIGLIIASIVFYIGNLLDYGQTLVLTDEEIIKKAEELGMIYPEEELVDNTNDNLGDVSIEVVDNTEPDESLDDEIQNSQEDLVNDNEQEEDVNTTQVPEEEIVTEIPVV
ncbi:MAG: hypothetical protein ACK5LY_05715, partial [Lachnospirales bacterium]